MVGRDLSKHVESCFMNVPDLSEYLCVSEPRVAQNRAAGLYGFNDLLRVVGGEGEARRVRVQLHGAAQRLLGPIRHAVCFVQDHYLMTSRRQSHLTYFINFNSYMVSLPI